MPTAFVEILTDNFGEWSSGFWVTTRLVFGALVIAVVVGTVVAALRIAPNPWLKRLGGVYVELFRNIPLLVLLLSAVPRAARQRHRRSAPWTAGITALGLYTGAYVAEVAALGRVLGLAGPDRGRAVAGLHATARRCGGSCCPRRFAR